MKVRYKKLERIKIKYNKILKFLKPIIIIYIYD